MSDDLLQRILELAGREDKAELSVANNGKISAMRAYTATPSKKSKEDYEVASSFYEETLDRLARKYLPEEFTDPETDGSALVPEWRDFRETKVKADILTQLIAMGYDLTQRTFYRHCKQGKCRVNTQGVYSRRLVKQYIEAEGILRTGEAADESGPDVAESVRKQKLENEKLAWHNKNAKLDYEKKIGALIERDGVYLEIAARYVALDHAFRQVLETNAAEIIATVGGDQARILEFMEAVTARWDEMLNSFVTMDEFEVLFNEEDGNDEHGALHDHTTR